MNKLLPQLNSRNDDDPPRAYKGSLNTSTNTLGNTQHARPATTCQQANNWPASAQEPHNDTAQYTHARRAQRPPLVFFFFFATKKPNNNNTCGARPRTLMQVSTTHITLFLRITRLKEFNTTTRREIVIARSINANIIKTSRNVLP